MFFYVANSHKEDEKQVDLGNGIVINKEGATINIGNQTVPLKELAITEYDNSGVLHKNIQKANPEAKLSVIFMKNYNKFLVLDERIYNSTYIQLFVLENYDKELFEPVVLDPLAKIYKLKI
jgi:dolichyl-diphosphooligosaccharide--protein glycosyltransferase/undecaprenyl-diphosphooligosaccharide--protein glycosyltransferase